MWKKVVAPTALVSLLWITASLGTTYYLNWLYATHQRDLSDTLTTIQAAAGMQDAVWRIQAVVLEAAATGRSGPRAEIALLESDFRQYLDKAEKTSSSFEEHELVRMIRRQFSLYQEEVHRRLQPSRAIGFPPSQSVDETLTLAEAVTEPCKRFLSVNERLLAESNLRVARFATSVRTVRLAFLVVGPLLGILLGMVVARGLHRYVSQISVTLKDATGQMEHELEWVKISPSSDLPELQQQVEVVSTQIRRVVEQLQEARHEAIRAERLAAVGGLAAGVAHEMRNPLTSIKLLVQMASQRYPDRPLSVRQLQVIQQEIARMENTIQSLLDFARPPALNRVRHDLRATLQRALNLTDGRALQERVVIASQWPDRPVLVDGDPEQLHQVFVNLLLNGIESMTEGGALQVTIDAEDPKGTCRVVFSDSGSGIPQPVMERIFEPFVTSKEHGTGLGLAVSRRIVQEHGGLISACNQARGAVFTVELPLSNTDDELPAGVAPSSSDSASTSPSTSSNPGDPAHADPPGH